jgi:hypothetical protein
MFAALLERRWQEFRRMTYGSAMIVAQKWNMYRPEGASPKGALEFVPGFANADEAKLDEMRQNVMSWFALHPDASKDHVAAMRARVIAGLKKQGYANAERMYDSIFEH